MNLAQLETEIYLLPAKERAFLAQKILLSLEELPETEFNSLWAEESAYRAGQFDNGKTQTISGEEVAKKARALVR